MNIVYLLASMLPVVMLTGCYTSEVSPNYARQANAILLMHEKRGQQEIADDRNESLQRLWSDVPEYAAWIKDERKIEKMPRLISSMPPDYPTIPLLAGVKGQVLVSFVISRTGSVEAARVLESSDSRFDQPAIESVLKWKFLPAELSNGTTIAILTVPIEFTGKTIRHSKQP